MTNRPADGPISFNKYLPLGGANSRALELECTESSKFFLSSVPMSDPDLSGEFGDKREEKFTQMNNESDCGGGLGTLTRQSAGENLD